MNIIYENKLEAINFHTSRLMGKQIHLHKELEVVYAFGGRTIAYADKNAYCLNAGDLFITFPNQVHYYDTTQLGEYLVLIFSAEVLCGFSEDISKSIPNTNYISSAEVPQLAELFEKLYSAVKEDNPYKMLTVNGYINLFMSLILPHFTLKTVNLEKNSAFFEIMDYCTKNFTEQLTLDSIAEKLHLSKYYISHLINKKLGQNFNEYINKLRINEACGLLRTTDKKISDISEEVGFGTIRSFNRSFRAQVGATPAEYRMQIEKLK